MGDLVILSQLGCLGICHSKEYKYSHLIFQAIMFRLCFRQYIDFLKQTTKPETQTIQESVIKSGSCNGTKMTQNLLNITEYFSLEIVTAS